MDESKVDMFIIQKGKLFPEKRLPFIREKLLSLDDNQWDRLFSVKFKDPFIAIVMSVVAGPVGADRFYLNQTVSGIFKLLLFIVFFINYIFLEAFKVLTSEADFSLDTDTMLTISITIILAVLASMVAFLIWYFIDISNASRKAKEINFNLILTLFN